jgi:hypothetical protein
MKMTTVILPVRGQAYPMAKFLSRLTAEAKVVFRYDGARKGAITLSLDGPEPLPETEMTGSMRLRPRLV